MESGRCGVSKEEGGGLGEGSDALADARSERGGALL